jgi:hypothetical protein
MLSLRISTVAAPQAVFVELARTGPDELTNSSSAQTMGCNRNPDPKARSRPAPVETVARAAAHDPNPHVIVIFK